MKDRWINLSEPSVEPRSIRNSQLLTGFCEGTSAVSCANSMVEAAFPHSQPHTLRGGQGARTRAVFFDWAEREVEVAVVFRRQPKRGRRQFHRSVPALKDFLAAVLLQPLWLFPLELQSRTHSTIVVALLGDHLIGNLISYLEQTRTLALRRELREGRLNDGNSWDAGARVTSWQVVLEPAI